MDVGETCPECGGSVLRDRCELVCTSCGLVVEEAPVSREQDWRAYSPEEALARARAGPPETALFPDRGLMTEVSGTTTGLGAAQLALARRLQRLQRRERRNADRALAGALGELHRICSALTVPRDIREQAAEYLHTARRKDLFRGRSTTLLAAASVLLALRARGVVRHRERIARAAGVGLKPLEKTYRLIRRATGEKTRPAHPEDVLSEVCSRAGAPPELRATAMRMLDLLPRSKRSGVNPYSIAAAALYAASLLCPPHRLSQREVADAAEISEITVRRWYRYLLENIQVEVTG